MFSLKGCMNGTDTQDATAQMNHKQFSAEALKTTAARQYDHSQSSGL